MRERASERERARARKRERERERESVCRLQRCELQAHLIARKICTGRYAFSSPTGDDGDEERVRNKWRHKDTRRSIVVPTLGCRRLYVSSLRMARKWHAARKRFTQKMYCGLHCAQSSSIPPPPLLSFSAPRVTTFQNQPYPSIHSLPPSSLPLHLPKRIRSCLSGPLCFCFFSL